MLRVTKILEGGLNLDRGEEIPRSMVVTNGSKEVIVPIPDSVVQELVDLFTEELASKGKPLGTDKKVVTGQSTSKDTTVEPIISGGMTGSLFETEPSEPFVEDNAITGDSGFAVGEEYDDSGTGVASL
jgi:hypothetical protein